MAPNRSFTIIPALGRGGFLTPFSGAPSVWAWARCVFSNTISFVASNFTDYWDKDIREGYNFICTNYVDGDDIVLIGFSRGAFTARSIADLIGSIGLLDAEGFKYFYPIFEDYENMADEDRDEHEFLDDSYKYLEKYNGQKGKEKILWENRRKEAYKKWLKSVSQPDLERAHNYLVTSFAKPGSTALLDSRHAQRWLYPDPDQSCRRLGHGWIAWSPCHACSRDQWLSRSISLPRPLPENVLALC